MNERPLAQCATDRELLDFIQSEKQKITHNALLDIAKDRGIFFSSNENRDSLAARLALLPHDFYSLQTFLDRGRKSSRGETVTTRHMTEIFTEDQIRTAIETVRDTTSLGKVIITKKQSHTTIKIEYSDLEPQRNALNQKRFRETEIRLIRTKDKLVARVQATEKADHVFDEILATLALQTQKTPTFEKIRINDITDHLLRTQFFTDLMKSIKDFRYLTATKARIEPDKEKVSQSISSDEDEMGLAIEKEQVEGELLTAIVEKISLKGNAIISHDIFKQLKARGFYIRSIVWTAREKGTGSNVILEAGFTNNSFTYSVHGKYSLSPKNPGELGKTLKAVSAEDKEKIYNQIEHSARIVLANIRASIAMEVPNAAKN